MLTHVDLFSGIGGFALAAQWAGFKTVAFVEIEPYAQEIIKERFGAVLCRKSSVITAMGLDGAVESDQESPVIISSHVNVAMPSAIYAGIQGKNVEYAKNRTDIRTFSGTPYRGATLLTGGFPCQPFSQAGKRRGKEDDRYLWPEMLRVISEARPAWVLGENVAGIVNMELDRVLSDLEGEGYTVQPLVIPACAVDAKHRRDRVWIVAYTGCEQRGKIWATSQQTKSIQNENYKRCSKGIGSRWLPEPNVGRMADGLPAGMDGDQHCRWPQEPPEVPRVATGIKNRVDRLKGLGNAIVPQVAYEILRGIAAVEKNSFTLLKGTKNP